MNRSQLALRCCLLLAAAFCPNGQERGLPPQPNSSTSSTEVQRAGAASTAASTLRMSKETRDHLIREFQGQVVYSRTQFPAGFDGLKLTDGVITPNGADLQQLLSRWGTAINRGDSVDISSVRIGEKTIHFDLNGGPPHRKKWYERIEVSGENGAPVHLPKNQLQQSGRGSSLDIDFADYVPEMSSTDLRTLLTQAFDFNARTKEEAYLNTLPLPARAAIAEHHVLVGMNEDMVLHAVGSPLRKTREGNGQDEYEEWIYGEPPKEVTFVRFRKAEVVRVETIKVTGEKIIRTEKEVTIDNGDTTATTNQSR
jgi:hypothetical protein